MWWIYSHYNFGYDTVKALGKLFGVKNSNCIPVEGLDIRTNDVKAILKKTVDDLPNRI